MSKRKVVPLIIIIIMLICTVFVFNKKSFPEEVLLNMQNIIEDKKDNDYFGKEIRDQLRAYSTNMENEGYVHPELSIFQTPMKDKIYILVKSRSIQHEDGYAVSYIILNIVGEKIIDIKVSTWATVSPEKRNF